MGCNFGVVIVIIKSCFIFWMLFFFVLEIFVFMGLSIFGVKNKWDFDWGGGGGGGRYKVMFCFFCNIFFEEGVRMYIFFICD